MKNCLKVILLILPCMIVLFALSCAKGRQTEDATVSGSQSATVMPNPGKSDLALDLSFDNASEGKVVDLSGGNAEGVAINNATFTKGFSGLSATFNGKDQYIRIPQSSNLNLGADDFSFAFWVKVNNPGSSGSVIFSKRNGPDTPGYAMTLTKRGRPIFMVRDSFDSEDNWIAPKTTTIGDGLWQHVVIAVHRNGDFAVFLNGEVSNSRSEPEFRTSISNDSDFILGAELVNGKVTQPFNGQVDDLRLYRHALSAQEVSNLFNDSQLTYADDGRNLIIKSRECGGIDAWSATIDKSKGGTITGFHLPADGPNLCESFFDLFYWGDFNKPPAVKMKGVALGELRDYGAIDSVKLLKREGNEIVVAVKAHSSGWYTLVDGEKIVDYQLTYTLRPDSITCQGEVNWVFPHDVSMGVANQNFHFVQNLVQFPVRATGYNGKQIDIPVTSSKGVNFPPDFASPKMQTILLKNGYEISLVGVDFPDFYKKTSHGGIERPWQRGMTEVTVEGSAQASGEKIPQPLRYTYQMQFKRADAQKSAPLLTIVSPDATKVYKAGVPIEFAVAATDVNGNPVAIQRVSWDVKAMFDSLIHSAESPSFTYSVPEDMIHDDANSGAFFAKVEVTDAKGLKSMEYVKFNVERPLARKLGKETVGGKFDFPVVSPETMGMNVQKLEEAKTQALTGGGSGCVIWHGKKVFSWGGNELYDIKSATKSFGALAMGLAVKDKKASLDTLAYKLQPDIVNRTPGQPEAAKKITLKMLMTHTAGFVKTGGYGELGFEPGTHYSYSDGGPNWLAECLTMAYNEDLDKLLYDRVFSQIGITRNDYRWRVNQFREQKIGDEIPNREFGSGIRINADAMAKIGYLLLMKGKINEKEIIPADWIKQATQSHPDIAALPSGDPEDHDQECYGYLIYGPRPKDADGPYSGNFSAFGLYDNGLVVIPSMEMIIVRLGAQSMRGVDHGSFPLMMGDILQAIGINTPKIPPFGPDLHTNGPDRIKLLIDGVDFSIDRDSADRSKPPVMDNGIVMAPTRFLDGLCAMAEWDPISVSCVISRGDKTIKFLLKTKEVLVDGKRVESAALPKLDGNKKYYPVQFISEQFGSRYRWDPAAKAVQISTR